MWSRTSVSLYLGMSRVTENATLDIKNRTQTITAEIEVPRVGGEEIIIKQRGRFGGFPH